MTQLRRALTQRLPTRVLEEPVYGSFNLTLDSGKKMKAPADSI